MLNWTVPGWPPAASASVREGASPVAAPFDLAQAFEAQTRLWNHFLDTNRSLLAIYAPWMQAVPWMWSGAPEAVQSLEQGTEPAQTADGVPDPLESQARLWNHMLDANRSFWSAVSWPGVNEAWTPPTSKREVEDVEEVSAKPVKTAKRRAATGTRRKSSGSR